MRTAKALANTIAGHGFLWHQKWMSSLIIQLLGQD